MRGPERQRPEQGVVSAGGLVYRRRQGGVQVVLAGRRRLGGEMVWSMPKGRVEKGESTREAALREVREETGISAEIEAELGDIWYSYAVHGSRSRRRRVSKQVHFFLMRALGGCFAERDAEMDAVQWFPIELAESAMTYENERALLRRARALVGMGSG